MKFIDWAIEERRFLKNNTHRGVQWLSDNIHSVCGNKRSRNSIQRVASKQGYSIKKERKAVKRAPRKTNPLKTADDKAQENAKFIRKYMW